MKKIISFILLTSFILQALCFSAQAEGDELLSQIELLENMGIYTYDDEMEYSEDELSREHMARILLYFYEKQRNTDVKEYTGKTPFTDLDETFWATGEIMKLVERGCLNGFSDGTFRADDPVTYAQVIKALVVILGYEEEAKISGGWSNGYMAVADKLRLGDGVSLGVSDSVTKGDFTKIISNALEANVMKVALSAGETKYEEGESLLNELGFFKVKGIVSATDKTSLLGEEECSEGFVKIGDEQIKTDTDCSKYLGLKVEAYYKDEKDMDSPELIYLKEYKNNTVTVEYTDIDDTTTVNSFVYYDASRKRTVDLLPDINFIFNERRLTYFSKTHLKPKNGNVVLIDADNDGKYETVKVKSYIDYIVSNVAADDDKLYITDKNEKTPIEINIEDDDWSLTKNGEEIGYKDIKKNMILSIAADKMSQDNLTVESDAEYFEIAVSDNTVEGNASSYSTDDNEITIDGTVYRISSWFDNTRYNLFTGVNGTFYLNANGEVCSVEYKREESYGFITRAYSDDNDEKILWVKIYTQDDEFVLYKCASNLKIDGERYKEAQKSIDHIKEAAVKFKSYTQSIFENANGTEQLVRFKVNDDGELTSIDTVMEDYDNKTKEKECFRFSKYMSASGNNVIRCFKNARNIAGEIGMASDMLTFEIPNDLSDTDGFGMMPINSYRDTISVPISAFDMDEFNVAKVIMRCEASSDKVSTKELDNMMIVEKKSAMLNSNDEIITCLSGIRIKNGQSVELVLSEKVKNYEEVKKGDIVRWIADNSGEAKVLQITSTADGKGEILNASSPYTSYYSDFRITYGTVYDISDDYILVDYANGIREVSILSDVSVLLECDSSSKKAIEKGDYSSIKTAKDYGADEATKIFMYQNYALPKSMVIYK